MNPYPILDLFHEYQPEGALREALQTAEVCHATIDRAHKRITLHTRFADYVPRASVERAQRELASLYSLQEVCLQPQFPAQTLPHIDPDELNAVLIDAFSPAASMLAGATWTIDAEKLGLHLPTFGKEALTPYLPVAARYVRERFGVQTQIELTGGDAAGDVLAQTEKIRRMAAAELPKPQFSSGDKAQPQKADGPKMIYGKSFQGKARGAQGNGHGREFRYDRLYRLGARQRIFQGRHGQADHRRREKAGRLAARAGQDRL